MQLSQNRYDEAAATYGELLKRRPDDVEIVVRLMRCYGGLANTAATSSAAKAHRKKARELAQTAEKLGTTDPLSPLVIASTAPDGTPLELPKGYFSDRAKVDALMREGETAFARHDFEKALALYMRAAEADPSNYLAVLFAGDALFAQKKFQEECVWFRKAIAITPDRETAHRYLGDALGRLGRNEEAFNEWIAAAVCDPYRRETRQHFSSAMRAAAEANGRTIPRFPLMRSEIKGDEVSLAVNPDDGMAMMVYNLSAIAWRSAEFAARYPSEKKPRRSLPEEIAAITAMVELEQIPDQKAQLGKWQPVLASLAKLQNEGLLEAFVLLERTDEELAKDYADYRNRNREKIEQYIQLYWCGF